jgi:M6 family metalloprotease-like protein
MNSDYDELLYSDGVHPTGSVRDYYMEVSYGAFSVTGAVHGWSTMSSSYDSWYDIGEIVAAVDPMVNFADYDGDGDGFVDALWLIHAGPGEEETHNPYDIWSHAYRGVYVPTADGVALDRWSMQPEEYASGDIVSIRVFCHEYGHILGLPDLYDYDDKLLTSSYYTPNDNNDHPMVDWDVMGYAGYNIMSYGTLACPTHFSAWCRTFLGWGNPEIPSCLEGTYQLYNVEQYSTQSIFKVPISDDGTEYFYLEYRNPHSPAQFDHLNSDFSSYFPWFTPGQDTLDAGLLVTHIDEKVTPNNGTPGSPNYGVIVVDAGYDPGNPWDGVSEFSEWWYPYEFRIGALYSPEDPGQSTLSPTTSPSSDGYGGPSGITISVVAQNNDYLTLDISRPYPPVLGPAAPVVLTELEVEDVPVAATDDNCTFPSLSVLGGGPSYATFADYGDGSGMLSLAPGYGDAGVYLIYILATDGILTDTLVLEITINAACQCPFQGDMIDALFAGGVNPLDPNCLTFRFDFLDCDGFTTALDLSAMIDYLFAGGAGPCDPCAF